MVSIKKNLQNWQKFVSILTLTCLLLLPVLYAYKIYTIHVTKNETTSITNTITKKINAYIKSHIESAKKLTQTYTLNKNFNTQQALTKTNFANVTFLDEEGNTTFTTTKNQTKQSIKLFASLHTAVKNSLSPIIFDNATNTTKPPICLWIGLPYTYENKIGTAIFEIPATHVFSYIKNLPSKNAVLIIAKNNDNKPLSLFPTLDLLPDSIVKKHEPVSKALDGQFGIQTYEDQEQYLITTTNYAITVNWIIVTQQNILPFLQLYNLLWMLLITLFALFFLVFIVSLFYNSKIIQSSITYIKTHGIYILIALLLIASSFLGHIFHAYKAIATETIHKMKNEKRIATNRIASLLQGQLQSIENIAYELSIFLSNPQKSESIKNHITELAENYKFIAQINLNHDGIDYSYDKKAHETSIKKQSKTKEADEQQNGWSGKPTYTQEDIFVTYHEKILNQKNLEHTGSLSILYSINDLKKVLPKTDKTSLYNGAILSTKSGYILYYSNHDHITSDTKISDFDEQKIFGGHLENILQSKILHKSGELKLSNNTLFYEPITTSHWNLITSFDNKNFIPLTDLRFTYIMLIILLFACLALFVATYLAKINNFQPKITHIIYVAYGLCMLAGMIAILALVHVYLLEESSRHANTIQKELNEILEKNSKQGNNKLEQIATGIFVETFDYKNESFSCNIWQQFNKKIDTPHEIQIENAFKNDTKMKQSYIKHEHDTTKIGWEVNGRLLPTHKKTFNYPFDNQIIRFILEPNNKDTNSIFIVDKNGYTTLNPLKKPGLHPKLSIKNFIVEKSFFSYSTSDDVKGDNSKDSKKYLTFNILIKRNLINAFLLHFLPLFVILLTIFFLIRQKNSRAKFTVYGQASLLFSMVFIHQNLRNTISTTGISYMEALILAGYLAVILPYFEVLISITNKTLLDFKPLIFFASLTTLFFGITFSAFYIW